MTIKFKNMILVDALSKTLTGETLYKLLKPLGMMKGFLCFSVTLYSFL